MVKLRIVIAILATLTAGVSWGGSPDPSNADSITFYACDWDRQGHITDRTGVNCALLRADGVDSIGKTDPIGQISIPYERLFKPGNIAVIFCSSSMDLQCTSIRLTDFLHGFSEFNVRVPVPEIIDRWKAGGPAKKSNE